ncbi:class I SAM-dependent methyltransferase [Microbacterium algeriense]|uniref:class I SAM-dependent methyltransferase n=1 Tax=Microbacterium algeriense TaxID=2615184 RepID=UPI0029B12FC3|nr:methyltransferase [Microbacterium algeriense]MDX2398776.1 methyltransferase [Microbacterium algeriense]
MPEFPYSRLRRWPDVEADNLQAHDATDLLLVERALALDASGAETVVIGEEYGAITLPLVDSGMQGIRVHQDLATGRRALVRNAEELGIDGFTSHELDAGLLAGARLVLLQLPKSLAELEEIADAVARWSAPDVVLIAGGRVKHMTPTQNDVLARNFAQVQPQRAERKSRLIVVSEPREAPVDPPFPVTARHDGLTLVAHGGAFAGARLDIGTRVLLDALALSPALRQAQGPSSAALRQAPGPSSAALRQAQGPTEAGALRQAQGPIEVEAPPRVLDLGCGTGALAVSYAFAHPEAQVTATDRSAAAVASARATTAANGVADRVTVTHDDAGSALPDASFDVVLLNPPFHLGSSVHTGAATRLFEAAARVLRPGGELFTVYNSSLGYRAQLERLIGPTAQLHRTPKFTVTRSIRRSGSTDS